MASAWGRIGCVGFGGPPTHIALLRQLCVDQKRWLTPQQFEDALAACNLLPGPASTQLAVYCAWQVKGRVGATIGGLAFVLPGLVLIIALAALLLDGAPPRSVAGAGAGAGAAVAAVAIRAGIDLGRDSWNRAADRSRRRWALWAGAGAFAAALAGPAVVVVLLGCGIAELALRRPQPRLFGWAPGGWLLLAGAPAGAGGLTALTWTALKVGALSYGGGFVIIPLMQADAIANGWMTGSEFLTAVALGQVTPGPVVHTVAVVGYAAADLPGAALAAFVAFAPSFAMVIFGAARFARLSSNHQVRSFLAGAGPAAIGAIIGTSIPLAAALTRPWQAVVLAAATIALLVFRAGVVAVLATAALVGAVLVGAAGVSSG